MDIGGPYEDTFLDHWEYEDDCTVCGGPIEFGDVVCDECTGLAHCIDDMCHGQGWCMHVKDAWIP